MRRSTKMDAETRNRLKRMKSEFNGRKSENIKIMSNRENYDQMVIQTGIPFMALCEHHHVAFSGEATVGYIPDNNLIGLSKMARVVERYLNPTVYTIQERATQQIANKLNDVLKPRGLMIVLRGTHGCISYRGVKKPSQTITSAIKGCFKEERVRSEFLELIRT